MLITIADKLERFIDFTGRSVSWLSLLMVVTTFVVVVMRYLFDSGSIAIQESVAYMHAILFLVGAAWTLQQDAHVRVDIIYAKCSAKTRALIDFGGSAILLLPLTLFIAYISWEYVADSWDVLEGSREAGGLPGVFILKSFILVMSALLVLQAIANMLKAFTVFRGES
jgi:TRAP-type mannitol/chloroaromatic compound transport system permease small subunit